MPCPKLRIPQSVDTFEHSFGLLCAKLPSTKILDRGSKRLQAAVRATVTASGDHVVQWNRDHGIAETLILGRRISIRILASTEAQSQPVDGTRYGLSV